EDDDTLDTAEALGYLLMHRRGDATAALRVAEPVLEAARRIHGRESARALSAALVVAFAYDAAGRHDDAVALLEPALPLLASSFGPEHPNTVLAARLLAQSYRDAGRTADAQATFDRAIAIATRLYGPSDGRTLATRARMGEMWL